MVTLDAIVLPEDILWSDEFNWLPVGQVVNLSLTGAMIIEEATQQKGRPITLKGDNDSASWIDRATLEQLRVKASTAGLVMTLNLRGDTKQVMFLRDQTPVSAYQVAGYADPLDTDYYIVTIRLMEV